MCGLNTMIEPTNVHRIRYMDSLFSVNIRGCVRRIGSICAEYELPTRAIRATSPQAAYYTNGKQSGNTTNAGVIHSRPALFNIVCVCGSGSGMTI
jgi:hypothetical protein